MRWPGAIFAPAISALMAPIRRWNSSSGMMAPTSMATKACPWSDGCGSSATQLRTALIMAEPVSTAVSISTNTASP